MAESTSAYWARVPSTCTETPSIVVAGDPSSSNRLPSSSNQTWYVNIWGRLGLAFGEAEWVGWGRGLGNPEGTGPPLGAGPSEAAWPAVQAAASTASPMADPMRRFMTVLPPVG